MPNREEDKIPDLLAGLREQGDGFSDPGEAYFEAMATRVIAKGKATASPRYLTRNWLTIAASALVLLLAGWWLLPQLTEEEVVASTGEVPELSSDDLFADIEVEAIDAYVSEQIEEFTLELYAEAPLKE